MRLALIYGECGYAHYLGSITTNHGITTTEMLDLIGLDDEGIAEFVQAQGWDGFDLDKVRIMSISESPGLERGDLLPERRIVLDTSEGLRYIDAPYMADMDLWSILELYDAIHDTDIYETYSEEGHAWPDDGAHGSLSPYDGEEPREEAQE